MNMANPVVPSKVYFGKWNIRWTVAGRPMSGETPGSTAGKGSCTSREEPQPTEGATPTESVVVV